MSRYELTRVWILVVLLPLSSSLKNNSWVTHFEKACRPRVKDLTDATKNDPRVIESCEILIDRGFPPGVYCLDEPYLTKLDWIWGNFEVYCEKAAGVGWIVIQRRGQFGDHQENFNRSWNDYARGFGDLNGEFWLGNEWIHKLTSFAGSYELRIEVEDWENRKLWGQYADFRIGRDEDAYELKASRYTGNLEDYFADPLKYSTQSYFSTYDRITFRNCEPRNTKSGWWTDGRCDERHLNGLWSKRVNLKTVKIMIRSRHYRSLNKSKGTNRL